MTYRAVLFDLDGTLLDTIEDLAAAMNATLSEAGLPVSPLEQHKFFVGDGVRNYLLRALPPRHRDDEELIARLIPRYRARYASGWADRTGPYEGIDAMLRGLGARGLRLAVLSNKPDDFTREMVAHYFPDVAFDVVRGAMDAVPLKPDPAAALAVARDMGLPPAAFVYLGDTATDMRTARSAGMFTVGALWGFRPREELADAGAQALIAHPADLLALL